MSVFIGAVERPNYRFRYKGRDGKWKTLYFSNIATAEEARRWARSQRRGGYGGSLMVTEIENINPFLKGEEDPEAAAWFERQQLPKPVYRKPRKLIPLAEYRKRMGM